jgi:hypothetical protein
VKTNIRMTEAEIVKGKANNPNDWFKTSKTIPPDHCRELTAENKKALADWRKSNDRAVNALRTDSEPDHKRLKTAPFDSNDSHGLSNDYVGFIYDHAASEAMGAVVLRPPVIPKPIAVVPKPILRDFELEEPEDAVSPLREMSPPTVPMARATIPFDPKLKMLATFMELDKARRAQNMASVPNVTATASITGNTFVVNPAVQFGRSAHPAKDVDTNKKE